MTRDLAAFYARQRELMQIADREWAARRVLGPFALSPALADWAAEVVSGCELDALPLTPKRAMAWGARSATRRRWPGGSWPRSAGSRAAAVIARRLGTTAT